MRAVMSPVSRAEAALGRLAVRALRRLQRQTLGVRGRRHTDARGRVTPYLECGTPRRGTLVWVHGFSDRFDTILQAAPHLVRDFRIVSPSVPGFGEGWIDPSERYTFGAFTGWLERVLRDVVHEPFHLMGNSLGGATALALAARMPDRVRSVVALNSAGLELEGVHCVHREMAAGQNLFVVREPADLAALNRRVFAREIRIPRLVFAHLFDESRRNAAWYARVTSDLAESEIVAEGAGWRSFVPLPEVRVPALVLWGDRDTLLPVAHGEHVARTVQDGRLELLEGVGHCAHLESPRRLADSFRRWAERTS